MLKVRNFGGQVCLPSLATRSSWRHSWSHLPHQGWKKKMRNHGRGKGIIWVLGKEEVGEGGHRAKEQKKRASLESPRRCSKHLNLRGGCRHCRADTSLKMLFPGKKRKSVYITLHLKSPYQIQAAAAQAWVLREMFPGVSAAGDLPQAPSHPPPPHARAAAPLHRRASPIFETPLLNPEASGSRDSNRCRPKSSLHDSSH